MSPASPLPPPHPGRTRIVALRTLRRLAAPLGAFVAGVGVAAVALPRDRMPDVALAPAPIAAMREDSAVAVKGGVAEVFGDLFIVADGSGRALVDAGRASALAARVAAGDTVTVEGRFAHGFVHASTIDHGDGRREVVGPPEPPPRRGLLSWRGLDGWSRWFAWRSRDG